MKAEVGMLTNNEFSQIHIEEVVPGLLRIHIKQNQFIAGEVLTGKRIFYSAPRSIKNLMFLYHGSEGGLGLNEEILSLSSFDTIKIKYNDRILKTTRRKWLAKGVLSRYCDATVDKQVVLKISEINMQGAEHFEPVENQVNLFEEVA